MSVAGSHLAGSVAPANVQAGQSARLQRQEQGDPETQIARLRQEFESHLQALEESPSTESPARLRVDGQLPEHQLQGPPPRGRRREQGRKEEEPKQEAEETSVSESLPAGAEQLYRHLDITV